MEGRRVETRTPTYHHLAEARSRRCRLPRWRDGRGGGATGLVPPPLRGCCSDAWTGGAKAQWCLLVGVQVLPDACC